MARAFAWRAEVILADEPASALDTHWRQVVLNPLFAEAARGAIVIVASSDPEVMAMCGDIVALA